MLSSDVLEEQFGPTKVDVLYQDSENRIITTRALSDDKVLELSWVMFDSSSEKPYPNIHRDILGGKSIGKAFRDMKVKFHRKQIEITKVSLTPVFKDFFKSSGTATVIPVSIYVGADKIHYCDILETYSPIVKWPEKTVSTSENVSRQIEAFSQRLGDL